MICNKLMDAALPLMESVNVKNLIIGLGYTALKNSYDNTGLAYVLRNHLHGGCSMLAEAGLFNGMHLADVAKYFMDHHNPLKAAIGLAAINSVTPHLTNDYSETDIIDLLEIKEGEHVGMVGNFPPLTGKIKAITPHLTILEEPHNNHHKAEDEYKNKLNELESCQVVIITATTLLNKTFEPILEKTQKADRKVLLGASTPLYRDFYKGTGINFASGVVVKDSDRVLEIASQGGGVMNFKAFTQKVTLILEP